MAAFSVVVPLSDDWAMVRDLRLAMLATDPTSFGSTLARELAFSEARWRDRCTNPAQFVALLDGRAVGMASLIPAAQSSPNRELVSVWTAPDARGLGVSSCLVRACIDAARASGARRLTLAVAQQANAARPLYTRLGFEPTGVQSCLPWDESVLLDEMSLELVGH